MVNPLQSPLELSFFGLTSKNIPLIRKKLFSQIHEIVFHGKGGYSWGEVYGMPTWLRNFTFNEIKSFYIKEKESKESLNSDPSKTNVINTSGKVVSPQHLQHPTYK